MSVEFIDPVEREKKGLCDRGKVAFDCADCGMPLMVFQITSDNDDLARMGRPSITTRTKVTCGQCGGSSHTKEISGLFHPGAAEDDMQFDIDEPQGEVQVFRAWRKG